MGQPTTKRNTKNTVITVLFSSPATLKETARSLVSTSNPFRQSTKKSPTQLPARVSQIHVSQSPVDWRALGFAGRPPGAEGG